METKGIKEKIVENIEFEKALKRDKFGEMIVAALIILIIFLIIVAGCYAFAVKIPISTYREIFGCLVLFLILDIVFMVIIAKRKISVSQREIKKQAKSILERVLFFQKQGKLETCYVILSHEVYVRTPEELELVISDLKKMLCYKNLADGGLHIAET